MRIDAHHHVWKLGKFDYSWMSGLNVLLHDFGPEELRPLLNKIGIDRTVLVQTIASVDETRWFLELSRKNDFIAGVVGWVDLIDPSVGETLDELRKDPLLKGVRHVVHDEPDPNWLLRPEVHRGLGELGRRELTYDLLIRPQHLPGALQVVKKFPGLQFVVDHIAKPQLVRRGWDDWAPAMRELARAPNVYCKLSGMITEADVTAWKPSDLKPYVEYVIEQFGVDRVMFGSDWPVCLLAGSYQQVVAALAENLSDLSPLEQRKVFGDVATRFYRLDHQGWTGQP